MTPGKNIRVLINPHSGAMPPLTIANTLKAVQDVWDCDGRHITYQFSKNKEDGQHKVRQAVADGVDMVFAVGGDGMINSVAAELLNTNVVLGVIPTGSGNGFARHFSIPLNTAKAVEKLLHGRVAAIDVGTANGNPFLVTCSMAWDAALVKTFEKSPVRGIVPYVFAAAYEFFEYRAQPIEIRVDGSEGVSFESPMVCTAANLTQYGGGAQIAPRACPDDGIMELVIAEKSNTAKILAQMSRLFDGSIEKISEVMTFTFKQLEAIRQQPGPIQVDGEIVETHATVRIEILEKALKVLVPGEDPS